MEIWVDAQLSPAVAAWVNHNFPDIKAQSLRSLGLLSSTDKEIFDRAKIAGSVIMTKDQDFYQLLSVFGSPPKIIWITCGNTSTANLCKLLNDTLPTAVNLLRKGEQLVEINQSS